MLATDMDTWNDCSHAMYITDVCMHAHNIIVYACNSLQLKKCNIILCYAFGADCCKDDVDLPNACLLYCYNL